MDRKFQRRDSLPQDVFLGEYPSIVFSDSTAMARTLIVQLFGKRSLSKFDSSQLRDLTLSLSPLPEELAKFNAMSVQQQVGVLHEVRESFVHMNSWSGFEHQALGNVRRDLARLLA